MLCSTSSLTMPAGSATRLPCLKESSSVNRPLLVFIDDVYGKSQAEAVRLLRTASDTARQPWRPSLSGRAVADAWFCSSQRVATSLVTNEVAVALETIQTFWEGSLQRRLALVLLDLQFEYGPVREAPIDLDLNWPPKADSVFGLKILQAMIDRWPDPAKGQGHCRVPVVMLSDQRRLERSGQANPRRRA